MDRGQAAFMRPCIDDYVAPEALVRVVHAFVANLDLADLGFDRAISAATGRPGYHPADMLRLYVWGYLNQVRSSRLLERVCHRDLEAFWLVRGLAPDYRTIAAFRHDNLEAIVAASAVFVPFCGKYGLVGGQPVALDGTKMRAVASPRNIVGAERLARDLAHTEREISYYLVGARSSAFRRTPVRRQLEKWFRCLLQGEIRSHLKPLRRQLFGSEISSLNGNSGREADRPVCESRMARFSESRRSHRPR